MDSTNEGSFNRIAIKTRISVVLLCVRVNREREGGERKKVGDVVRV